MPANSLVFKDAESVRDSITKSQQIYISGLYSNWAKEIGKKANEYASQTSPSSQVMARQLQEVQDMAKKAGDKVSQDAINGIRSNMYTTANTIIQVNEDWLKTLGFDPNGVAAAFGNVPMSVVQNLVTGNVYKGGWNLSKAIWGNNEQVMKDLYEVVAAGVAQNMSTYDIAKLMEQYIDPSSIKPWNLKSPDGKPIFKKKVDYNAQRLARTLVQHTYQQSFQAVTKDNPFIHDYVWNANGSRVCELCKKRDGKHFPKDRLPLDHPNGMCTMVPNMDSMDDIANKLADWAKSPGGKYPGIDKFANKLKYGGTSKAQLGTKSKPSVSSGSEFAAKYGTSSGAKFNYWYTKLDPDAKLEAKKLKDQSGLTWQQWYEQNIYAPKSGSAKYKAAATANKSSASSKRWSFSDWKKKIAGQTESRMLATEAENFARMTDEQSSGIRRYTGSAYREMNGYLRYRARGMSREEAMLKAGLDERTYQQLINAKDGLKTSVSKEEYILRRGTDLGDLAGFMSGDFDRNKNKLRGKSANELNGIFAGQTGTYAGFTSTSSLYDRGFSDDVEIIIYAPQGTQGTSVMTISQFGTDEGEFLLNAGTQVRIDRIEESDGHMGSSIRVYMEIVGVDDSLI